MSVRSYFRVDPKIVEKKLAAGYTPAQIGAFLMLLSQAEQQPQRGRFRSLVELKAAMDCMVEEAGPGAGMSKYVPLLLKEGDVVKLERGDPHYVDGHPYYVEGWDEWQEGNWQVAERMRRVRERKNGSGPAPHPVTRTDTGSVTPSDTAVVTPAVTVDVTAGVTGEPENASPEAIDALQARLAALDNAYETSQVVSYEPVPEGVLAQIADAEPSRRLPPRSDKPPSEFRNGQNVTVGVTARDARRSAAAATAPIVAVAAEPSAVSRRRQTACEADPLPMPLSPEVAQRSKTLTEGCLEILVARPLRRFERDYIQGWAATLRRGGELVPVEEILATVRIGMTTPKADGSLPANLGWVADDVATLARERASPSLESMPRATQEAVALDRVWAERAAQLRQEGR